MFTNSNVKNLNFRIYVFNNLIIRLMRNFGDKWEETFNFWNV